MPHLLESFARIPEVLIILNHPFWLEEGVQDSDHRLALPRFLGECLPWIHALELNGTRSWKENAAVVRLAESYLLPFISGGDRHAGEPAACINLTNAQSFAEFVSEVRCESSTVLFLPQYRNPMGHRILEASWDIVRSYPEYPGREHWTDRFFYYSEDGIAQPLSLLWKGRVPWMLDGGTRVLQAIATTRLSHTLRFFGARREESLP